MKKEQGRKNVVKKIICGLLIFCIVAGSVLKFINKDASSVLLTIFNTYTLICITGLWLLIAVLIFVFGRSYLVEYPEFRKSPITKAKIINTADVSVNKQEHTRLTVEFTDKNNSKCHCDIITDSRKAAALKNNSSVKIRYKIKNDEIKAIIAGDYCNKGKIAFLALIMIVLLILMTVPVLIK